MWMKWDRYSRAWNASLRGKQRIRCFFAALSEVAETEVMIPSGVVASALVKGSWTKTIRFACRTILSAMYGPAVLT